MQDPKSDRMLRETDRGSRGCNGWHRGRWAVACLMALGVPAILSGHPDAPKSPATELPPVNPPKRYEIKPTVPSTDRHTPGKVFLERADRLWTDDSRDSIAYQILVGNVQFRKDDMFMYCDSAHFYDQEGSFDAFGNVRMEQGDTLFVYADELNYNNPEEMAVFYGNGVEEVRLINKEVQLTTDVFNYDLGQDLGYYTNGGTLADTANVLTSVYGEYSPATKDAQFRLDVVLKDKGERDFTLTTEELLYNTDNHIARIVKPSVIVTDSATVYSSNGMYNTEADTTRLYDRSLIKTRRGNTLTGDTLFYDQTTGFGEAWGNMILTDSARQSALEGGYGCYFDKEDSSFATIRARLLEYSRKDTLYLHGDTIRTYVQRSDSDSTHIMTAYPRVRFWRVDLQGLCDSLSVVERDSLMYMHRHPIVWSGERQVFGNVIQVHFNDSTVDWAKLPEFGFVAEHIGDEFYNQLTGREMLAQFADGSLSQLDVSGNVENIMLPQENDSTYNKIISSTSSYLTAHFNDSTLQKLTMWPDVDGTVTPLYLAKKSIYYLPQFKWYEALRPKDKDDIFNVPPEMEALLKEPDPGVRRRRVN